VTAAPPAALQRLAAVVRDEGGLLGDAAAAPAPGTGAPLGALASRGPRAAGHRDDVAFVVEAVREGYLLHHGAPRVVATEDPDLALLAGDRLYALGLARLADLGLLDAVAELADVIGLCSQAHAAHDPDLAGAAWEAGAAAVGWGPGAGLEAAKSAARAGDPEAPAALRAAARRLAGDLAP
jgi:hypothetical protein